MEIKTTAEQVYEQLRDMVLEGKLLPNQQLVQRTLAHQLGVSPMPVVEALRWLERDGLVVRVPKWGVYVKAWTPAEYEEAFLLRRALECEAVAVFIERASAADRERLQALNDEFNSLAAEKRYTQETATDHALHLHLTRGAGLSMFERTLQHSMAIALTVSVSYRAPGVRNVASSVGLHDGIVAAILEGNVKTARAMMYQHIDDAWRKSSQLLANSESNDKSPKTQASDQSPKARKG